jgi:hypothetical protein
MQDNNIPVQSASTLVKALLAALLIAVILFVSVVLPAEYNIDPTGIGTRLGLTVLAVEAPVVVQSQSTEAGEVGYREDEITITVPANKGLEYKFHLKQYGNFAYEWSSGETALHFDLHGEPEGDTTGYFESFTKADSNGMSGSITVPFTGAHGWYWKNNSGNDVTVSLKTRGDYEILGLR